MSPPLGASRRPREVELKFHLPPGSRALLEQCPVLTGALTGRRHLVSTYFDTPDKALEQLGLTLRVRHDGSLRTQTVKSLADAQGVAVSRGEWEWPIRQDTPDLGWLAVTKELAAVATSIGGRLRPQFTTDIYRTTRRVDLGEGATVEVAFDEGDIEAGLAHEVVSELEIELKSGCVKPLYRLAAELQLSAPMWLMSESKASRGRRLRTGDSEGAQNASPPQVLGLTVGVTEGLHQILDGALGHLTANMAATMRGDPEGLHQSRIAVREALAVLLFFGGELNTGKAMRRLSSLRRYDEVLGVARDWDVFCLETVPSAIADLPRECLEGIVAAAGLECQAAHAAVSIALQGRAFSEMILELAIWNDDDATKLFRHDKDRAQQRLSELAASVLDRAARTVRRRSRRLGRLSETERHSLRKSLKALSFYVRCLSCFYEAKAVERYRLSYESLVKILGDSNDAVVAARLIGKLISAERQDLSASGHALKGWIKHRRHNSVNGLQTAMARFRNTAEFWT